MISLKERPVLGDDAARQLCSADVNRETRVIPHATLRLVNYRDD